ncbi:MAG: right-handed parallel beta-helix repeat-containing protein, partial [Hymenobacter sp.]
FDPTTKLPFEAATAFFIDGNYGISLGNTIVLQKCDNVEVADIMLNGSSPHLVVGGHWGDTGIQLPADGLFVQDSRRITLRRLAVHHFGRDGIQVLNRLAKSLDDPNREDILLENSTFDYNGRQGLSITGANGLRAVNCSFSHTGRVVIPALGKVLFSNPGAGVDIEPEGGVVSHVRLASCRFVDNAGQGLVSDHYGDAPPVTKDIVLTNCLLWGVTNWSVWLRQPGFLFENCRLYGAFVNGCAQAAGATRFVGCTFEDRPYRGQAAYGLFLVHSDKEARRMSFANCHFIGHHSYLLLARPAAPDTASAFRLRNCTFRYDYGSNPPLGTSDQLLGAVFSGSNTLESSLLPTGSSRLRVLLGDSASSSPVVVAPGSLRLAAASGEYVVQSGLTIGSLGGGARVEVANGNVLVMKGQPNRVPELYIGPTSQLVVKKGGALIVEASTKVLIDGQLVVEEGAYFYQDPQAEVRPGARGQLRLAPGAIQGRPPVPTAAATPAVGRGN